MNSSDFLILKSSGEKVYFSEKKVEKSLQRAGADKETIGYIIAKLKEELYDGISTKEIYNRAFKLLKNKNHLFASKYKLKKAIYELGPTGFPFERFVASILNHSGYSTKVGEIFQGKCVSHEVDIYAIKNGDSHLIECKFHGKEGRNCDVKVPLYIHSRFRDIVAHNKTQNAKSLPIKDGWVVTNTRFTEDAITYGNCVGLHLLSWNHPSGMSLKDLITNTGLYPITVSTLLTIKEKQFLLEHDIVLCTELIKRSYFLDHIGVSENRQKRILKEMRSLCAIS
ncbi:MAG TPA: ATP cone domain-containing protein [Flavobacteriaceae bacterium]|nr:ATP cone domain-containing protein [Flavobacteriaceae bacterium]